MPLPWNVRKLLITALVSLGLAVALGAAGLWGYRRVHPASLDAWVADVAGPEYELRYRTRTRTHYVALFQVGPDQLAFCRRRVDGAGPPDPPAKITDVWGRDLVDPSRPREELFRVWHFGLGDYEVVDGELVPIRPGYNGPMRIVFDAEDDESREDGRDADPYRLGVLDVHIRWGELRRGAEPADAE